jgi:mRNA-degrading endonuclease YafQ of YafQ-DinJ toxin-antitoxin module
VKRLLLQSPAFGRDLKKWLKSHSDTTDSIAKTLEQLSADARQAMSLRSHKLSGALEGAGRSMLPMTFGLLNNFAFICLTIR